MKEQNLLQKKEASGYCIPQSQTKHTDQQSKFQIAQFASATYDNNQYCPVCFGSSLPLHTINGCQHRFCSSCISSHIKNRLMSNEFDRLTCPQYQCPTVLHQQFVIQFNPELLQLFKKMETNQKVRNDPNLRFCPWPNCGSVVYYKQDDGPVPLQPQIINYQPQALPILNPQIDINRSPPSPSTFNLPCQITNQKKVLCTYCNRYMCFKCGGQYHYELSCQDAIDPDILSAVNSSPQNLKFCPSCKTVTQWNQGCMTITCKHCNAVWCWRCHQIYQNNSTHVCKQAFFHQLKPCQRVCLFWCFFVVFVVLQAFGLYMLVWVITCVHIFAFAKSPKYPCLKPNDPAHANWERSKDKGGRILISCILCPITLPFYILFFVGIQSIKFLIFLFENLFLLIFKCKLNKFGMTMLSK